ncbi:MAG: hypothetical protein EON54_03605 [Alcaligenaceae bacterium]|nr:MAG: hypothetical protein EON54_03605 [Alcaligenaceae bacterium]
MSSEVHLNTGALHAEATTGTNLGTFEKVFVVAPVLRFMATMPRVIERKVDERRGEQSRIFENEYSPHHAPMSAARRCSGYWHLAAQQSKTPNAAGSLSTGKQGLLGEADCREPGPLLNEVDAG